MTERKKYIILSKMTELVQNKKDNNNNTNIKTENNVLFQSRPPTIIGSNYELLLNDIKTYIKDVVVIGYLMKLMRESNLGKYEISFKSYEFYDEYRCEMKNLNVFFRAKVFSKKEIHIVYNSELLNYVYQIRKENHMILGRKMVNNDGKSYKYCFDIRVDSVISDNPAKFVFNLYQDTAHLFRYQYKINNKIKQINYDSALYPAVLDMKVIDNPCYIYKETDEFMNYIKEFIPDVSTKIVNWGMFIFNSDVLDVTISKRGDSDKTTSFLIETKNITTSDLFKGMKDLISSCEKNTEFSKIINSVLSSSENIKLNEKDSKNKSDSGFKFRYLMNGNKHTLSEDIELKYNGYNYKRNTVDGKHLIYSLNNIELDKEVCGFKTDYWNNIIDKKNNNATETETNKLNEFKNFIENIIDFCCSNKSLLKEPCDAGNYIKLLAHGIKIESRVVTVYQTKKTGLMPVISIIMSAVFENIRENMVIYDSNIISFVEKGNTYTLKFNNNYANEKKSINKDNKDYKWLSDINEHKISMSYIDKPTRIIKHISNTGLFIKILVKNDSYTINTNINQNKKQIVINKGDVLNENDLVLVDKLITFFRNSVLSQNNKNKGIIDNAVKFKNTGTCLVYNSSKVSDVVESEFSKETNSKLSEYLDYISYLYNSHTHNYFCAIDPQVYAAQKKSMEISKIDSKLDEYFCANLNRKRRTETVHELKSNDPTMKEYLEVTHYDINDISNTYDTSYSNYSLLVEKVRTCPGGPTGAPQSGSEMSKSDSLTDKKITGQISATHIGKDGSMKLDGNVDALNNLNIKTETRNYLRQKPVIGYKLARTIDIKLCIVRYKVRNDSYIVAGKTDVVDGKWLSYVVPSKRFDKYRCNISKTTGIIPAAINAGKITYDKTAMVIENECTFCLCDQSDKKLIPCNHMICKDCYEQSMSLQCKTNAKEIPLKCPTCSTNIAGHTDIKYVPKPNQIQEAYAIISTTPYTYQLWKENIAPVFDRNISKYCGEGFHFCTDITLLNNYAEIAEVELLRCSGTHIATHFGFKYDPQETMRLVEISPSPMEISKTNPQQDTMITNKNDQPVTILKQSTTPALLSTSSSTSTSNLSSYELAKIQYDKKQEDLKNKANVSAAGPPSSIKEILKSIESKNTVELSNVKTSTAPAIPIAQTAPAISNIQTAPAIPISQTTTAPVIPISQTAPVQGKPTDNKTATISDVVLKIHEIINTQPTTTITTPAVPTTVDTNAKK